MIVAAAKARVTVVRWSAGGKVQLRLEWLDEEGKVLLVQGNLGHVGVGDSVTFDTHPDLDVE